MLGIDYYNKVGKFFGYPECCIKEFQQRVMSILETGRTPTGSDIQAKASENLGFLPCKKHAQEILDGKITLKDLIKDRICEEDFPYSFESEDKVHIHLENYLKAIESPLS